MKVPPKEELSIREIRPRFNQDVDYSFEELKELLEIAGVTLGALGGGAAIIFGSSSWLGKIWA